MRQRISLAAYTFSHFCVDFACFYMLFSGFRNFLSAGGAALQTVAVGFLLYNILAFGLQPFIGYACDARKGIPVAATGCALLLTGLALISLPWVSLVLCALGNACFHVGGGIDSLVHANGRMARSGIFVSSGAIGVSLGMMAGQSESVPLYVPMLLIAVCGIALLVIDKRTGRERSIMRFNITGALLPFSAMLALCLFSIVIRAYIGASVPIPWKTTALLMLLPSIGACSGKAAGGYLADKFGAKSTGVVTLLLSIPFLCLGYGHPVFCTVGIFLFNITMPVTLCAVASGFPHNPGLSFGLTTLGLLCGSVPTFFFAIPANVVPIVAALCIAASAACLFVSIINTKKEIAL
ncbi:MAG: hypothetical protein BWY11_02512 [Firmicutes bacterium ADurb.Bin182]|nr:MAG: hypothetical protein BWY11_02512 [Firmicutes bacterium ADurb.Bin182]